MVFQIAFLSSVGGRDLKGIVKGVLNRLFTIQIQGQITISGSGLNIVWGFQNGPIYRCISEAVTAASPASTQHAIKQAIAQRLRYACDARGGIGREEKKKARLDR